MKKRAAGSGAPDEIRDFDLVEAAP